MPLTLSGTSGVLDNSGAFIAGTAVNSTSGTSIDFTGIPSWVKRITVMFNGVSFVSTGVPQVQLGSGSVQTTGYTSNLTSLANGASVSVVQNATTGFIIGDGGSAGSSLRSGTFVFTLLSANLWVCSAWISHTDTGRTYGCIGVTTLSGSCDRVRITTTTGGDTFDAGSINILYE